MSMFERIIIPLDGTRFAEAALQPACGLASAFGSRLVLVRAVPPHGQPSGIPGLSTADGDGAQSQVERINDADAYLHEVQRQLCAQGYDVSFALELAPPGTGIAEAAAVSHADLVVLASHLRWKAPAAPEISATLDLLVRSRVPVLVWRATGDMTAGDIPSAGAKPQTLLSFEASLVLALDGTSRAEAALPMAEVLAHTFGLAIVLVRAVGSVGEEDKARRYLCALQERLEDHGVQTWTYVATGDPLLIIEGAWRQYGGGLIAMVSRGHLGPLGTFFGSLAARIIEEVEAPLLVLRPMAASDQDADSLPGEHTVGERQSLLISRDSDR